MHHGSHAIATLYTYPKKYSHNKIKLRIMCKKVINTLTQESWHNSAKDRTTNSHIIKGDKSILVVKI